MSSTTVLDGPVVIAVDPHKASWTAAAVSAALTPLATITVQVGQQGYRQLRRFADRWPAVMWAIEGASGPGGPLAARLAGDGIEAVDVPAKLAARVRMLSTGHGRKNDNADAISVGVAALTASGLRTAAVDETILALRALIEHRDDIVRNRTQMINRLHVLLAQLLPGGAPGRLTADAAATLLRGVRPRATGARTLRRLAVDLVAEIRHLDRRIAARNHDITTAVTEAGCTLAELRGIGTLLAAKILSRVGDVYRFRSAAAFATFNGTAPLEVSSGGTVRHRLSRAGDRQLNCCLHIMAITQLRRDCPGRRYYLRKRAEGKGHKEALRCLKRRLSDLVYRQLLADARHERATSPGGQQGATTEPSAAGSTPTTGSSDESLPGLASVDPTAEEKST
jgi:transposase